MEGVPGWEVVGLDGVYSYFSAGHADGADLSPGRL